MKANSGNCYELLAYFGRVKTTVQSAINKDVSYEHSRHKEERR